MLVALFVNIPGSSRQISKQLRAIYVFDCVVLEVYQNEINQS